MALPCGIMIITSDFDSEDRGLIPRRVTLNGDFRLLAKSPSCEEGKERSKLSFHPNWSYRSMEGYLATNQKMAVRICLGLQLFLSTFVL